jgi:alpha/beta superfamily hydrolase
MDWNEEPAELARAITEQPVIVPGEHGHLYGIFTPPAPDASPAGLCVILLGRNRWWGDRLSVKGARWLAARGFACLRFDYHGYGESEGSPEPIEPERPYPEDAIAAINYLRKEFGQQRFVLSGFCFDARTALSVVEQEGASIEAIVAISVPPGEKLTRITMFKVGTFLRMPLSAKRYVLKLALRRRLHPFFPRLISHPERVKRIGRGFTPLVKVSESFKRDIRAIVRSRVRCLFLNGTHDTSSHNFKLVERSILAKLDPPHRALFTLETWPERLHVPHDPGMQRRVTERALMWIDGLRPKPIDLAHPAPPVIAPQMNNGRALGADAVEPYAPASLSSPRALPATKG